MKKQRYKWIRRAALTGALTLPVVTAGCGWFSPSESKDIDPPQGVTGSVLPGTDAAISASSDGAATVADQTAASGLTVYLKDKNGYLAPVTIQAKLDSKLTPEAQALELLVSGGPYAKLLPEGFTGVLPQGTEIRNVQIDKKTGVASVDFSKQFYDYNEQEERSIVEAVTWTLTGMEGVSGVSLWEEGEKLQEMPVGAFPLDRPLTRAVGINLEAQNGVDYSLSTPVTLYFSGITDQDAQYYVPVTRLVPRTSNKLASAMKQLAAGPLDGSSLTPVWVPDVSVKTLEQSKGTVTVDLSDAQYKKGEAAPSEMLQAVVLSLTENSGAGKVQIKLNGQSDFKDSRNVSYTEPVSRPEHLNAFKS